MAGRAAATTDGIDSEWLDRMVKKLFMTLEDQLQQVAKAGPQSETAAARAADARTLSSLERTLERLARLEGERAALREKKVGRHDANARAALERRLDKLLAGVEAQGAARKPE